MQKLLEGMAPTDVIEEVAVVASEWVEAAVVDLIKRLRTGLEERRERADSAIAEAFGASGRKGKA